MLPSSDTVSRLLSEKCYGVIPFYEEILADMISPLVILRKIKNSSSHCFLLESAEDAGRWGRYSFLGYDPVMELTCMEKRAVLTKGRERTEYFTEHPEDKIREILAQYRSPKIAGLPTLTGGFVGFFAYDYIRYSEPRLKLDGRDTAEFKDIDLMFFDKIIAFDHARHTITLIYNQMITPGQEAEALCADAGQKLQEMKQILREPAGRVPEGRLTSEIKPLFQKERYCSMVERAKQYIHEGDIFQVVLSNRLEAGFQGSLFSAYRILRQSNPSPYMFYFSSTEIEVAGASPETLVKLEDGKLHTFPLAGTRPRGKDSEEDAYLERELLEDEKELSEHNMLVDLGRNDLGKISKFGSVAVEKYMKVEKFSHVMHIGSAVRSEISPEKDALDAVAAVLPAGTLSGAPKIRACEIIQELEQNRRGIYGGAIGYLDLTGNMDTCIAIRIAYKRKDRVYIRSGAGIVADSVPEKEYQECMNKARAVCSALRAGEEVESL